MIVVDAGPELLLVTQPDHARVAADLLSLWNGAGLAENPRRAALLLACREHDNGWREADSAPRCDPDGRPYDFIGVPAEARFEIWRRGTARYARRDPYAALLITRHALALHRRYQAPGAEDFLAELAAREAELRGETGAAAEDVEADYRLLDLADKLSLAVCMRNPRLLALDGLRARYLTDPGRMEIDPPPAASLPAAVRLPYRRIPRRTYAGDADLGGELAAARWQDLQIQLAALAR